MHVLDKQKGDKMTLKNGDRVIIKNVPEDYCYKDLYKLINGNQNGFKNKEIIGDYQFKNDYGFIIAYQDWRENNYTGGFSGYIPYKCNDKIECSGCGNSCKISDLVFIGEYPAPFWIFDGAHMSGNGLVFFEPVNHYEIDFNLLK
jgi:hypothetical protein